MIVMHRLATANDFDAVYDIYMHPDVVPYLGVDPMPRPEFRSVFDALVTGGGFFVVDVDGRVRAFYRIIRYEARAAHGAYLGTFAVAPSARGTGLARAIIEHAIAGLRDAGILRVELQVEADNPRAIRFYETLGFQREGRLRAAYKRASEDHYVDEILMARYPAPARMAPIDARGERIAVGDRVRILSIPRSLTHDLPADEVAQLRQVEGTTMRALEIDAYGYVWFGTGDTGRWFSLRPCEVEIIGR